MHAEMNENKKGNRIVQRVLGAEGVDERVSGQASACIGATRLFYHIISLQRGARVGYCSGKAMEEAKLEGWSQRCSSPPLTRPHPGHEPRVGARLRLRQRAKMEAHDLFDVRRVLEGQRE